MEEQNLELKTLIEKAKAVIVALQEHLSESGKAEMTSSLAELCMAVNRAEAKVKE